MRSSLRSNGRLGQAGVLRTSGAGRAVAAVLVTTLLTIAVVAAAVVPKFVDRAAAAGDLSRQVLVGSRNLTCQRVVVLLDQSGSMADYSQVRIDAMETLANWGPHNLRSDDQLAVVRWADTAVTEIVPTDVSAIGPSTFVSDGADVGGGTEVLPAVEQVAQMPDSACRTSLVFVSDGEIGRADQGQIDAALQAAGVDRVSLVLPNSTSAPEYWMRLFPYSETFYADPNDSGQTARALGQAIASATGQQLVVEG